MKDTWILLFFALLFFVMGGFLIYRVPDLTVRGDTLGSVWGFLGVLSAAVFGTVQKQTRRIRSLEEHVSALQGRQK